MIVWLLAAAGVWLAAVCAICMLMTAVKHADTRFYAPPRMRLDLAAGGLPVNEASGVVAPPISAIAVSVRESSLAARTTAIATGGEPQPSLRGADVDYASCRRAYPLYLNQEPVAQLHWHLGPNCAVGWYLSQRRGDWQQLLIGPDFKLGSSLAAPYSVSHETTARAASVSSALDAAVTVLDGPRRRPSRPLRTGHYEVHASELPAELAPIAFPDTVVVRAGDVAMLAGHFDDLGLTVLTRRIAILGGRVLAIFHADSTGDGQHA